jgi:hypothetical protein
MLNHSFVDKSSLTFCCFSAFLLWYGEGLHQLSYVCGVFGPHTGLWHVWAYSHGYTELNFFWRKEDLMSDMCSPFQTMEILVEDSCKGEFFSDYGFIVFSSFNYNLAIIFASLPLFLSSWSHWISLSFDFLVYFSSYVGHYALVSLWCIVYHLCMYLSTLLLNFKRTFII